MLRTARWFFVTGVLVAVATELLWREAGYYTPGGYFFARLALVLWPTSIIKMVLDDKDAFTPQGALFFLISFLANGVLYGIFGMIIGAVRKVVTRSR
jgi:hypothetical protein